jgi:hypothetical protein
VAQISLDGLDALDSDTRPDEPVEPPGRKRQLRTVEPDCWDQREGDEGKGPTPEVRIDPTVADLPLPAGLPLTRDLLLPDVKGTIQDYVLYVGAASPGRPDIGDLRVSYRVVSSGQLVTVFCRDDLVRVAAAVLFEPTPGRVAACAWRHHRLGAAGLGDQPRAGRALYRQPVAERWQPVGLWDDAGGGSRRGRCRCDRAASAGSRAGTELSG